MNLADKKASEIDTWIRNHEEQGATSSVLYRALLEERARRAQASQKLSLETSLDHLKHAAINNKFTTYGALADASNVPWSHARHQMNGAHGHLDTVLDICHAREIPLLTAICVNRENLSDGKLGSDALAGFGDAAKRLGLSFTDAGAFHERCVEECFEWGGRQKQR